MHPPAGRSSAKPPPPTRDTDPTVRLEAGDAGTLAALYDRYAGDIYSLALRITGEPADAEAIVHAVFAAAWTEAGRRPGEQAPDTHWLLSTARIRAIDHSRAREVPGEQARTDAPRPSAALAGGAAAEARADDVATLHLPDPARAPARDGVLPEEARRLRAAFRGLPPLERLAIELAYFEGLTISQIAARIEQSPDAANARIRTGLGRLAGRIAASRRTVEPPYDSPPARDLAGLYALGALNASDRAAFDAHLEVHRESVDEVLTLLPVTRRLCSVAPPHEPPAGMRARVIETVTGAPLPNAAGEDAPESSRGTPGPVEAGGSSEPGDNAGLRPEPEDTGSGLEASTAPRSAEPVADGSGSQPVDDGGSAEPADDAGSAAESPPHLEMTARQAPTPPLEEPRPPVPTLPEQEPTTAMPKPTPGAQTKGGRRGLLVLAAGSLVVAAGLGWFAARQANLAAALQENLDAANTQARIAELETAAAQRIADELRGSARVLTAADVQTLDLEGQPAAPDARGLLFWSPSEGGVLTVAGLPPAPPGRVYHLWLIPEATPVNVAALPADAEGSVMASVTAPVGMTDPVPAAVTLEPTGAVATPSGDVYLLGRP